MKDAKVEGTKVKVRYDPFDIRIAYAYIKGKWIQCRAEKYINLGKITEKQVKIIAAIIRKRNKDPRIKKAITSGLIADFAKSNKNEELELQKRRDLASKGILLSINSFSTDVDGPHDDSNVTSANNQGQSGEKGDDAIDESEESPIDFNDLPTYEDL